MAAGDVDELVVGAGLGDVAALYHHDAVGVSYGGEPVGDDEAGAALEKDIERLLDQQLRTGVDGGGGLVQYQYLGVVQQRPCEGHQLPLAHRQGGAPLVDLGLIALLHLHDEVVGVHGLGGGDDFFVRGVQPPVADVVHDGAGEYEGVLHHHAHLLPEGAKLYIPYVVAVDLDRSAHHVVEPGHQIDHGGFARAGGAHQGDGLAGLDGEGHVLQNRLGGVIIEGHMVELHLALHRGQGVGVWLVLYGRGSVHDLEYPLHGGHGGEHGIVEVGQGVQRLPEPAQVPQYEQKSRQVQRPAAHQPHAEVIHQGGADVAGHVQHGPEGVVEVYGVHPGFADVVAHVAEGLVVFRLPGEVLGHPHAGQGLMEVAVEVGGLHAHHLPALAHHAAHLEYDEYGEGHDAHADEGQLPVDHQHDHQQNDQGEHVHQHVHDAVGEQVVQAVYVVYDPDQELTGAPRVEKGEGHALYVVEKILP